jgi:hypothetical protein
MHSFDPEAYGPTFRPLLDTDRRRPLDIGEPDRIARGDLNRLSLASGFAHVAIVDRDMASCCIAGVWLVHDFLDESHTISQSIETPSGSYWHAIMHRREGDFSNAKYWLRRVGRHPVIDEVGRCTGGTHDPFEFIDRCEAIVRGKGGDRDTCLDTQRLEWELLFEFCYREAIGASRD